MVLGICVILLVLGALLRCWHWRRSGSSLCGIALLILLAASCGPLPNGLLHSLQAPYARQVTPDWGARNAIVLLGAGTERLAPDDIEPAFFAQGRIDVAAELYHACHATGHDCKVLISGGDPQKHGAPEATVYGRILERLGVPASDQIIEAHSANTWQNAQFSRPLLLSYAPDTTVMVTSGIHLRRSLMYFAHFGLHPEPVRGDYIGTLGSWWPQSWNLAVTDAALHEWIGIGRYHLYNALGWNAPRVQ